MAECIVVGNGGGGTETIIGGLPKINNVSFCGTLNMIGECWVDNYITYTNYIKTTNPVSLDNADSWKICVHFKCSDTNYSYKQALFGAIQDYYYFPSIEIHDAGELWVGYTQSYNFWDSNLTLNNIIFDNDEYYIVYYWNSTTSTVANIEIHNVTQGTFDTHEIAVGGAFYASGNQEIEFGGICQSYNHNAQYISICLIDTYIEVNDEIVFGNKTNM